MGSKSKPTIGYWYKMLLHFGLTRGPIDALLEFRGGERAAWAGVATGGTLAINARELWGGEKAEGGIEGELDVMLGGADQMPSARLAARLGDMQSAFRGRASVAFEGLYGAFNPYPKAASFKVRRIFEGWDGDVCWYPEKAAVDIAVAGESTITEGYFQVETGAQVFNGPTVYGTVDVGFVGTAREIGEFAVDFRNTATGSSYTFAEAYVNDPTYGLAIGGYSVELGNTVGIAGVQVVSVCPPGYSASYVENGDPSPLGDTNPSVLCTLPAPGVKAMNPAHIVYDALTSFEMQGEPSGSIDEASFLASANLFHSEGFGLCARYNPATQTPEDFSQRICSIAGATLSRSRVDGKYYLKPRRGVHDLESLPILTDDDILEYEEEPSDPLEAVNQVTIEWFDPLKKQKRTTTPIQALGAIQALGGVVAESLSYPEIPSEALALRVGARDLAQKSTPLKRFRLTTNRVPYAWLIGDYFRLQAPRRGIADMVCEVGEIDSGTPRSGSMRLVAIQDVSQMPASVYVEPEPGVDTAPTQVPIAPPAQRLLEAPYIDLAGDLLAGEMDSLSMGAGFVLAVAARPASGINYTLETAAAGEALADRGTGDWCPTAVVVEAGLRNASQVTCALDQASDLDLVDVGSAALWGNEIVRVEAIDPLAITATFSRGCADTVPDAHPAGERIWFYDAWAASDRREYAGGESVSAKLRTRTSSQVLSAALAPMISVDLDERAGRPYPPGRLRITDDLAADQAYPSECTGLLTVSWAHRDRVLQADQLLDAEATSVGPEPGTTYTVRYYLDGVLEHTEEGISSTSATPYAMPGSGLARVEVEAVRGRIGSAIDINGDFEAGDTGWEPDPANAAGGTFSIVMDPAVAISGDWGLKYEGVPGAPGDWVEEHFISLATLHPDSDVGPPIRFGISADVPGVNAGTQMLVLVDIQLELRAVSDDSLLIVYGAGEGENSILRGWGKIQEGVTSIERRFTYGQYNGRSIYFRPRIRIRSIPMGTPPAGFTVHVDRIFVEFEGDGDGGAGPLVSWQAAAAEFEYTAPADGRLTDAGDARITDSGERRTLE